MRNVRNLDNKLVCKISEDRSIAEIVKGGCLTRIEVSNDGKLLIENTRTSS